MQKYAVEIKHKVITVMYSTFVGCVQLLLHCTAQHLPLFFVFFFLVNCQLITFYVSSSQILAALTNGHDYTFVPLVVWIDLKNTSKYCIYL